MKHKLLIRLGIAVLIGFFAAGSWITSGTLNLELLKYLSGAVFVATTLFTLWDVWLWSTSWMQKIPGVPVNVRGTWKGTLISSWIDETGKQVGALDAYLVIRQTSTLVHIVLMTNESKSESSLAGIVTTEGLSVIQYLFFNKPKMRFEKISRMHHGSATLEISGKPARRLEGRYWTDRDTKGELDFALLDKKVADDYEEAVSLFPSSSQ